MYLPMYDYNLVWLIGFFPYFPGRVTVYGIVSHTRQTTNSPSKCGNTPSFFADVDYFLEFIKQSIKPPKRRKPKRQSQSQRIRRQRMRFKNGKKVKNFDYHPPDEYESESNGNIYKILWKTILSDLGLLFNLILRKNMF